MNDICCAISTTKRMRTCLKLNFNPILQSYEKSLWNPFNSGLEIPIECMKDGWTPARSGVGRTGWGSTHLRLITCRGWTTGESCSSGNCLYFYAVIESGLVCLELFIDVAGITNFSLSKIIAIPNSKAAMFCNAYVLFHIFQGMAIIICYQCRNHGRGFCLRHQILNIFMVNKKYFCLPF